MSQATEAAAAPAGESRFRCVDCDVHASFPRDWHEELEPYLPEEWRPRLAPTRGVGGAASNLGYELPGAAPWYPIPGGGLRRELMDGTVPASDPRRAASELLDRHGIDRAIILHQYLLGLGVYPNPDVARVIARAGNDYVIERWVRLDERWRATITIAPQDPPAAVREIDRLANVAGVVGIMLPQGNILMGQKHYWPIYAAAEHHRLPIVCHLTSVGVYANDLPFPGGPPIHYLDWKTNMGFPQVASLTSMVANGVFTEFPGLQVMFVECGFAFLAELMWRMDMIWRSTREITPWLQQPPSDYVIEHCTFSTQPFIEPRKREHIGQMLDMVHAERTLVFSSDYPHYDFDDPMRIVEDIPEPLRRPILAGNATRVFGDRLD
jgi:predicted TIM-barrel fold metal-dependent hydrolase